MFVGQKIEITTCKDQPIKPCIIYPNYFNKRQLSSLPVAELLESVENVEGWDCKFDPTIFLVPGFRS